MGSGQSRSWPGLLFYLVRLTSTEQSAGLLRANEMGYALGPMARLTTMAAMPASTALATGDLSMSRSPRRGGTLVSARVPDADRSRYEAILDRSSVNLRDRGAAWRKAGWQKFDPNAPPYTIDEIRKERELYRS
jgi:hypothetical protein